MLEHRQKLHFKEILNAKYVMGRNTNEIYTSGIKRDFKSCVMKDSSRYCCPDRCSGPRRGASEGEVLLAPNVRLVD